jgi:NAD-dependent deacetylase
MNHKYQHIIPKNLISMLRTSNNIVILTGSGVSAESGIPTFREAQTGIWEEYDPHELATPQAFRSNPSKVWEWYLWRRNLIHEARPNPGHVALAEMEQLTTDHERKFSVITQNIDGLHQKAGSQNIIELHGNIMREKCSNCEKVYQELFNWTPPNDLPQCLF